MFLYNIIIITIILIKYVGVAADTLVARSRTDKAMQ